ncbi:MAG: cbb3-type cytochrome c oxidase subunit I [Bacteroidota bacterium]|nr:cbb3-type cytochrome c oxidase subunit I [Bacteroidota bacterium]
MKIAHFFKPILTGLLVISTGLFVNAQTSENMITANQTSLGILLLIILIIVPLLMVVIYLYYKFQGQKSDKLKDNYSLTNEEIFDHLKNLTSDQIKRFIQLKRIGKKGLSNNGNDSSTKLGLSFLLLILVTGIEAQTPSSKPLFSQAGIIITILCILIPVLLGVIFALVKANNAIKSYVNSVKKKQAIQLAESLNELPENVWVDNFEKRNNELNYALSNTELAGNTKPDDKIGIIQNVASEHEVHFTALKKKAAPRPSLAPDISKLIIWYIGCSVFWLALGGAIGEYVGIKFISPEVDEISWLSFGRLRPVHTNMVFWGWASLGILGLGHYVVPTVSNTKLYSIRWGWISLILINVMVILGTLSLMAGINNGGGEFREYIWPITALFAVALILTLINFIKTVANRTSKEIYISNWYIVSSILFTIILALVAYLPFWQNGIGETIVQGYYMHTGVGMWFTLFTLGLLYYFIPQQLNKPIYAYSLGILAFWTQILFYTVIGTHHFVFSAVPWWLQTVGIVGSAGMIIPVVAGTINFTMTFKGQWNKVSHSYTLPFFLVAVVYYFIVSMQGTAQAFKFSNLLWHFTDFTVAHSHLGFYGIITFAIWGGVYAIIPRLTGKEPPQLMVGAHFWMAFVGLLFYAIPLSIGGTLRGMMWMEGKPFIDSVVIMFDYWLWRAIGGSLMFLAHFIFAYNFYKMVNKEREDVDVKEDAIKHLELITENKSI